MPRPTTAINLISRGRTITFHTVFTEEEGIDRLVLEVNRGSINSPFAVSLANQHTGSGRGPARRLSASQRQWVLHVLHENGLSPGGEDVPLLDSSVDFASPDTGEPPASQGTELSDLRRRRRAASERRRERRAAQAPREQVASAFNPLIPAMLGGGPLLHLFRAAVLSGAVNPRLRFTFESNGGVERSAFLQLANTVGVHPSADNSATRLADGLVVRHERRTLARVLPDGAIEIRPEAADDLGHTLAGMTATPTHALSAFRIHGARNGRCVFCARPLSVDESLERGYGPDCAQTWGLPWGNERGAPLFRPAPPTSETGEPVTPVVHAPPGLSGYSETDFSTLMEGLRNRRGLTLDLGRSRTPSRDEEITIPRPAPAEPLEIIEDEMPAVVDTDFAVEVEGEFVAPSDEAIGEIFAAAAENATVESVTVDDAGDFMETPGDMAFRMINAPEPRSMGTPIRPARDAACSCCGDPARSALFEPTFDDIHLGPDGSEVCEGCRAEHAGVNTESVPPVHYGGAQG